MHRQILRPVSTVLFAFITITLGNCGITSAQEKQWCEYPGGNGPGKGKHIVLIAGDDEYRSEEALPMLGKILAVRHGFKCTVLFPINEDGIIQPNYQESIPGMDVLESADLVILGLRFRNLPEDQMEHFDRYVESGKPIIGLRTSTHAFRIPKDKKFGRYSFNSKVEGWEGGFGQRVLGDTWVSHHGHHGKESTRGIVNSALASHPVLFGVDDVWGPSDVYEIKRLPSSAQILMYGQVIDGMKPVDKPVQNRKNDPMMPLVWLMDYKTSSGKAARILCTTMGAATDFESDDLRRVIVNSSFWMLGLEKSITRDLDVSYVDKYEPTDFGFETFKKGRRPKFYDLKN